MIKVSEKTQDSLAELWYNKDFQVLVKLLQNLLDLLGKGVLTIRDSEIIKEYQIQKLTTYIYELATAFSHFYRDVRVIGENSYNHGAFEMIKTTKNVLAKSLFLLGISAPEKM